jgi:general secretion pathway protein C
MARIDFKTFRDRFVVRAERTLTIVAAKLERLPPLSVLVKWLTRFRWAAYALAGFLTADLVMLAVGVYLLSPKKAMRAPPPRVVVEAPYVKSRSAYDAIVNRNLFCPGCVVPPIVPLKRVIARDCGKARPVNGSIKVLGTIVLSDPQYSVATVSDGGTESTALRKGDSFRQYGRVFEIRRNRVCFESPEGLLTYVELPEDAIKFGQPLPSAMAPSNTVEGINRVSENDVEIKRNFLVEKLNDPNILFQAHAVPFKDPSGNIRGFKILSIMPGSVYENLGLQVGDAITGVNGEPMNSISKAQELYAAASTASEVTLEIERNGQTITKRFRVK